MNEERLYQIREECDTKHIFMTDKDCVKLIMEYLRGR